MLCIATLVKTNGRKLNGKQTGSSTTVFDLIILGWNYGFQQQGNNDLSVRAQCQLKFVKEWGAWEDESSLLMMLQLFLAIDDSCSIWGN